MRRLKFLQRDRYYYQLNLYGQPLCSLFKLVINMVLKLVIFVVTELRNMRHVPVGNKHFNDLWFVVSYITL